MELYAGLNHGPPVCVCSIAGLMSSAANGWPLLGVRCMDIYEYII